MTGSTPWSRHGVAAPPAGPPTPTVPPIPAIRTDAAVEVVRPLSRSERVSVLRACHLPATLAVTAAAVLVCLAQDGDGSRAVLLGLAVLAGQLAISLAAELDRLGVRCGLRGSVAPSPSRPGVAAAARFGCGLTALAFTWLVVSTVLSGDGRDTSYAVPVLVATLAALVFHAQRRRRARTGAGRQP